MAGEPLGHGRRYLGHDFSQSFMRGNRHKFGDVLITNGTSTFDRRKRTRIRSSVFLNVVTSTTQILQRPFSTSMSTFHSIGASAHHPSSNY